MTWRVILSLPAMAINAWQIVKDDLLTLSFIVCAGIFLHLYVRCMKFATKLGQEIARRGQLSGATSPGRLTDDLEEKSEIHFRKKCHIKRNSGDKKNQET